VALLLDGLPLHCWIDRTHSPPTQHWSVRIPVIPSAAGNLSPPASPLQNRTLDTGFSGEAFAWRHQLEAAGLDPDQERGTPLTLRWSATNQRVQVPVREADLWIIGNVPGAAPYCVPLDGGVAFLDRRVAVLDPELQRSLIGIRVLRRAKLKFELDFARDTVSMWTP
jgi:hypothetical protein